MSSSPKVTEAGWQHLMNARLMSLNLSRTPLTDTDLRNIGMVPTLETLMISDAPISDIGLMHLKELKALTVLSLRGTKITEDGVAQLRRSLPNLRHVSIDVNRAAGARAPILLPKQINFTENQDSGEKNAHLRTPITAEIVKKLQQESNLDTVFLSGGGTQDGELALLADVPMKGLFVNSEHVTDRGVKSLEEHATLESLTLFSCNISDLSAESIARIPSLTKISIQRTSFTDEGARKLIDRLGDVGKLKSLNFFQCPRITDDGLVQIGELESLERLFLNNNDGLTSGIFERIAHLKNLTRLEVDSISLDEADLAHLTGLTKLETLGVSFSNSSSHLTDRAAGYLCQLSSLQSLTIQDARITDKGGGMENSI